MARSLRLNGFALFAALLALGALLAWPLDPQILAWHGSGGGWPWRAFSAAFVHWSALHLAANLAGCAVLAWLGLSAGLPARCAVAWVIAWPLTQMGLLLRPELLSYGGLSGVLHAGVAVAAIELLLRPGRDRRIGAGIALGLALKVTLEYPFGPALQQVGGWDIAVAPFAHLSGAVSGAVAGALTTCVASLAAPRSS